MIDYAKARQTAPAVAEQIALKRYDYSRPALRAWQRLVGLEPDGIYGGRTAGALAWALNRAAPRPLFKPTTIVPFVPSVAPIAPAAPPPPPPPPPVRLVTRPSSPRPAQQTPRATPIAPPSPLPTSQADMARAVDAARAAATIERRAKPATKPKPKAKPKAKASPPADLVGTRIYHGSWSYRMTTQDLQTLARCLMLEGRPYNRLAQVLINRWAWFGARGKAGKLKTFARFLTAWSSALRNRKNAGRVYTGRADIDAAIRRALTSGPVDIQGDWLDAGAPWQREWNRETLRPVWNVERKRGLNVLYARRDFPHWKPYSLRPPLTARADLPVIQVNAPARQKSGVGLLALAALAALAVAR